MKRFITVLALVAAMVIPASAQEEFTPLKFELRGTFTTTDVEGQAFQFKPSFGFVTDLGFPVDFGGSWTSNGLPGDESGEGAFEAFVVREIRTWQWGNGRSLKLEALLASDIAKDQVVENRVYALGLIYDHGLISYTKIGVRGSYINRDKGPNDWMLQGLVQIDAIK